MDRIYKITIMCSKCSIPLEERTQIGGKSEYTAEDLMPKYCEKCESEIETEHDKYNCKDCIDVMSDY